MYNKKPIKIVKKEIYPFCSYKISSYMEKIYRVESNKDNLHGTQSYGRFAVRDFVRVNIHEVKLVHFLSALTTRVLQSSWFECIWCITVDYWMTIVLYPTKDDLQIMPWLEKKTYECLSTRVLQVLLQFVYWTLFVPYPILLTSRPTWQAYFYPRVTTVIWLMTALTHISAAVRSTMTFIPAVYKWQEKKGQCLSTNDAIRRVLWHFFIVKGYKIFFNVSDVLLYRYTELEKKTSLWIFE